MSHVAELHSYGPAAVTRRFCEAPDRLQSAMLCALSAAVSPG